ncbi:MAG TPA: UDP-3-O-(3-hydroxymyristoyl)glucosamine N-acyltransferase [Tepidisphaeraceae bacterium]|jgi:UDP-3-O-[3-hydroxymyristoyl] glucosamine N-acyltransferase|nr:UDP-3-O-(3-hydroxymyristoyl)glucosamine N-acyltransferase [Tepidisphaeraceae bacterium]
MPQFTLADIASLLNLPLDRGGRGDTVITGLATLAEAKPGELSFLGHDKYVKQFTKTKASAVIVDRRVTLPAGASSNGAGPITLTADNADLAMSQVLERFAPPVPKPRPGRDHAAFIAPSASIGDGAAIGPNVFVGDNARIGRNVVLHPGVYIGADVSIGDDCVIFPNSVVRERITIGNRVIINAGSVIGTDGFGYRWDGRRHAKVPQIGTIEIGDDVEIGSCVCIDRAKFAATVIGPGTKIDNLVQIAHNVKIGPHCIIVGQVGLAGSAELGAGVVLGGQVAVRDHAKIGDGAMAAATSAIVEDVAAGEVVMGTPALPRRQTLREQAAIRKLPDLRVQVQKLAEEIERLKTRLGE